MPQSYGKWHAIHTRINRRAKNGVLQRAYAALASEELRAATAFGLDSTASKAHPDARGAEKNGEQATCKTRGGRNTKIHVLAAGDTVIAGFLLTGGNEPDAAAGRLLPETLDLRETTADLVMYRACFG